MRSIHVVIAIVMGIATLLILAFMFQNQGSGFENFILEGIGGNLFG